MMVTIDKRVVRDGVLIAFEGQVMSEEEAKALGLIAEKAQKKTPPRNEKPKVEKSSKGK